MAELKYIFAQPDYVEGIDKDNPICIYPVRLKDYDKFSEVSHLLHISKNHFENIEYPLLLLIFSSFPHLQLTQEELVKKLEDIFSITTRQDVKFISNGQIEGFIIGNSNIITIYNYEEIRNIILKQNLIHEQKIYKTKIMNDWAQKALKAKQKNASKILMEDIITTVSVGTGKNYSDLENYTIYQIYSDFYRLRKMVEYDTNVQFKCVGADLKLDDYAEDLDIFHNPYDDLFVSSDKLGGLNKALK